MASRINVFGNGLTCIGKGHLLESAILWLSTHRSAKSSGVSSGHLVITAELSTVIKLRFMGEFVAQHRIHALRRNYMVPDV